MSLVKKKPIAKRKTKVLFKRNLMDFVLPKLVYIRENYIDNGLPIKIKVLSNDHKVAQLRLNDIIKNMHRVISNSEQANKILTPKEIRTIFNEGRWAKKELYNIDIYSGRFNRLRSW